ncbi:CHAD domain-containing protein [Rhabdothermincola salaria]|uniref:CYTH and CHAD domain-containing protein n=1 Tax=Rhabdothermincola salaria TaxID=2903142 RepID=UPI001E3BA88E|nr:CHAD domain-containing protein [Rhabdothermincola salaria]
MSQIQRFAVVGEGDPETLLAAVAERTGLVPTGEVAARRIFLDTADGRVRKAGGCLEMRSPVRGRQAPTLVWSSVETGETLGTVDLARDADPPRWVEDLPDSPVRDRLAPLLEMRVLLPQAEVMSRLTMLAERDDEGKTTARLVLDDSTLLGSATLPPVVEVLPVRGYEKDATRLAGFLAAQVILEPVDGPLVDLAREALDAPAYLSSKLKLVLDPDVTAEEAWREVLSVLASTMAANLEGTRDDTDSEFLHDYRVAVRRTRSVLQEGRGVLPDEARARWRQEFKWLGDITTPTRDADVHLLDLPALVATLPAERAADLEPLHDLLVAHQQRCHDELVEALDSERAAALVASWDRFLTEPWTDAGTDASRPAPEVAAERLAKAWKRVVRDGRRIGDDSPAELLHDLRKDAKRLRYLLECFGSLLDREVAPLAVKALKGLQDCLGEFQDTEVQADALGHFGDALVARGDTPAATLLAMGGVVEHLGERGRRARQQFAGRFAAFDHPDTRRVFRRLIDVSEGTDG